VSRLLRLTNAKRLGRSLHGDSGLVYGTC
jgi:hypothetical protein